MPRMIELIRQSAVPPGVMRTAAKGGLSLPPIETVEVLVYLAEHSPNLSEDAKNTLAAWTDEKLGAVLVDPQLPPEIFNYFTSAANCRPSLLGVLVENPAVPLERLAAIAGSAPREMVNIILKSDRGSATSSVLRALLGNPLLSAEEAATIKDHLTSLGDEIAVEQWIADHAEEIKAEEGKPFSLIGGVDGMAEAAEARPTEITTEALANAPLIEAPERLTTLQKLAKLTVAQRVLLAVKGSRDERYILIRDGSKIVSSAVLVSPKVSESEVEVFASMKNVQENVLRDIGRNRRFMKNYLVVKNLATNPRTPLDLSLTLIKNLTVTDLKSLSQNTNVPDTLRKMATKLFKTRTEKKA